MTSDMRVFISYKNLGPDHKKLPDAEMAKELYEALQKEGIPAFFSEISVIANARNDYKALIDENLDKADVLVLVSTKPEHCISNWVRYEWESFYNDLLSGIRQGRFVSYLDNFDVGSFQRTIRNNEVFQKQEDGLNGLMTFIKNYLATLEDVPVTYAEKGSSYNYRHGDEKKRLSVQASVELKEDYHIIEEMISGHEGVCNILDVGCSVGTVTFEVFKRFGESVKVVGIDKFEECVVEFNRDRPEGNMVAYQLNLEDDDWLENLQDIMKDEMIPSFDLIYCSLSLHHMSDSGGVLKKLFKITSDGGHIFIRTCDDGLKIAYPNNELIQDVINMTASAPRVSDRFHGRKIYDQLMKAHYSDVHITSFLLDTCNMDATNRYALFMSTFAWRKNYFKNQMESAVTDTEKRKAETAYRSISDKLDEIEDLFSDPSFYFGYYVTIATATKKKIGL